MDAYAEEFPLLPALGLYAAEIRGDGNCLFNALSDQISGNQNQHNVIRARVITYMRTHADYYKQFLDVKPGGGTRRNPKRKNAGAFSSQLVYTPPTPEEIDRAFDSHIDAMAKGGVWGDNMEIVAFAAAYNTNVRIYLRDYSYMIPGQGEEADRSIAHIAYHEWEHYSSIRNKEGPHTGMPKVVWKPLSQEDDENQQRKLSKKPQILPWQIDVVRKSLPFLTETKSIRKALEDCNGNVNNAASMLLDDQESGSLSSTLESSSVEREPDSDDDTIYGPNKRANRNRMQRAARQRLKQNKVHRRSTSARLAMNLGSQESLGRGIDRLEIPDSEESSLKVEEDPDSQHSDFKDVLSAAEAPNHTRLKINPPRSPEPTSRVGKSHVRQQGPRQREPSARERKELKKLAQKAARKQRHHEEAAANQLMMTAGNSEHHLPTLTRQHSRTPIPVEGGMKTLYI